MLAELGQATAHEEQRVDCSGYVGTKAFRLVPPERGMPVLPCVVEAGAERGDDGVPSWWMRTIPGGKVAGRSTYASYHPDDSGFTDTRIQSYDDGVTVVFAAAAAAAYNGPRQDEEEGAWVQKSSMGNRVLLMNKCTTRAAPPFKMVGVKQKFVMPVVLEVEDAVHRGKSESETVSLEMCSGAVESCATSKGCKGGNMDKNRGTQR